LILVVDDERPVRDLVAAVLTRYNYRVLTAADGVEAISHFTLHAAEIALVVTDVDMPLLGGRALGRILAQLRPDLRLLVMSGLARNEPGGPPEAAAEIVVHEFLQKPFTFEALLEAVDRLLHPGPKPALHALPLAH
jgi:CheY-like chemotaxis protein